MRLYQYRPACFEGFNNEVAEFSTKEELLEIEFVKSWKAPIEGDVFTGFMLSDRRLMATYNYNTGKEPKWYVVATFETEDDIKRVKDWFPKFVSQRTPSKEQSK